MKAAVRRQVKTRVSEELSVRLKRYCAAHNVTETAVMNRAIEQCLTGADQQSLLMRRLDQLAHEIARVGVAVEMLGEMFGSFTQTWLAHNPELPEPHKASARRDALRRYQLFVAHVLSGVAGGRTHLSQLVGPAIVPSDQRELERVHALAALRDRAIDSAVHVATPDEASP